MATYSKLNKADKANYHTRERRAFDKYGISNEDFYKLCLIENTLNNWHCEECNGTIQRDEETDKPIRYIRDNQTGETLAKYEIKDLENGAKKRARRICQKYSGIWTYWQNDPRGCSLYIYGPDDIKGLSGGDIGSLYSSRCFACYF